MNGNVFGFGCVVRRRGVPGSGHYGLLAWTMIVAAETEVRDRQAA
jgi:hypothetical protein